MPGIGRDYTAQLAGNLDDLARAFFAHPRQHRARHAMRAKHVGFKHQPGGFHVLHFDRRGNADTRIIDQHINRPAIDHLGLGHTVSDLIVRHHVDFDDVQIETLVQCKDA